MSRSSPLDAKAFRVVYDGELAYVARTLRRLGVAPGDVEDLAHDLFVIVSRQWSDYDPARPLRAWLFGIAVRLVSNYRQRARHHREVQAPVLDVGDGKQPVDDRMADAEARARVLAALDELDFDQRVAVVMHDLEERTAPEVAELLGVPLNTIYSRLRLARRHLAEALGARAAAPWKNEGRHARR